MLPMLIVATAIAAAQPTAPPDDVFARRILPLAQSSRASSCTECHFGGVDLRQYVLDDAATTFAALRSAGLINVERPAESKLLAFIGRKPEKENPLLAKVREEEYAAFRAWIEAAVADPAFLKTNASTKPVGPPLPVEVVRHGRRDRVLESFVENVWVDVERCVNCHSPDRNAQQVKKHGEQVSWISPNDPAGTLATIIEHELIDVNEPEKSLILLKPLAIVEHGGHKKFPVGSRADQMFRRFLTDYAAIVRGRYRTAADLPTPAAETYVATGQHLRVTDLPDGLAGKLLRVDLYRWNDGWSATPVATADGPIGDKQLWQNIAYAVVPRGEAAAAARLQGGRLLPAARYQARLYVDRTDRLSQQRDDRLTEADRLGTVEFEGPWKPGYLPPKIVSFKNDVPR
jgi:hypothetical protein